LIQNNIKDKNIKKEHIKRIKNNKKDEWNSSFFIHLITYNYVHIRIH
jgi:hypothetical protein